MRISDWISDVCSSDLVDADGNLISTALDFTTLGIAVGQVIHVGGIDVANQFFETENTGFARVRIVAANKLTLDKRDQAFIADDGTDTEAGGTGQIGQASCRERVWQYV